MTRPAGALAIAFFACALSFRAGAEMTIAGSIPVVRDSETHGSLAMRAALAVLILLALAGCAVALRWRSKRGLPLWPSTRSRPDAPAQAGVRRINRLQLNRSMALETVEFDGQVLLLAVSDSTVNELARTQRRSAGRDGTEAAHG